MNDTHYAEPSERLVEFLNSRGVGFEQGNDLLASASAAKPLLAALGHKPGKEAVPPLLEELRQLRDVLQDMLAENRDAGNAAAALDRLAAACHFRYRFSAAMQAGLEAVTPSVTARLIEDVASLLSAGNWDRVKTCANPDCRAVFYDPTRARTRRWHAFEICGNKNNVARFRQRAAAEE